MGAIAIEVVEFTVFVFNFLCALVGVTLFVVGFFYYVSINEYYNLTEDNYTVIPILVIMVGAAVFTISFLGCRGVRRKSECMLITYAALLSALFITQLTVGIVGYVQVQQHGGDLNTTFVPEIYRAFEKYGESNNIQTIVNTFQITFKCCGVQSYEDYDNNTFAIPGTCCEDVSYLCSPRFAYPVGCAPKLFDMVMGRIEILASVALSIAVIELIGSTFAAFLVYSIRNEGRNKFDMPVHYSDMDASSDFELVEFV